MHASLPLRTAILPFLVIILIISFNIDSVLKTGINLLSPISIHKLEGTELHWKSISFREINLSYKNMELSLDRVHIDFGLSEGFFITKPLPEKVSINTLSLLINNADEGTILTADIPDITKGRDKLLTISDYRPETIYQQLNKVDIRINQLEITQSKLFKKTLVLSDFNLEKPGNNTENLKISTEIEEPRTGNKLPLEFIIGRDDGQENYKLNIFMNNANQIQISLDFNFDETDNKPEADSSVSINTHLTAKLDQGIHDLLEKYLPIMETVKLKQLQTDINFIIRSRNIIDVENPEQALLETNIETKTLAHAYLNNQAFNELIVDSHIQIKGEKDINGDFLQILSFPKRTTFTLIPNKKHDFYKDDRSLAFLSSHPVKIALPDNSTWKLHQNKLSSNSALSMSWSTAGSNVYLDAYMEQVLVEFTPSRINTDLSYRFSGRWNRYFSSEHQGKLALESQPDSNQHTMTANISDSRLASTIKLFLKYKQNKYAGNFDISIPDISKATKHINQALGYWDHDLKLLAGSLAVSGDFNAQKKTHDRHDLSYKLDTKFSNINMDYDGVFFQNLNTEAVFQGHNSTIRNVSSFPVRIESIDAGVILKKFEIFAQLQMDLEKDSSILFSGLSAQILGGKLAGEDFTLYLPKTPDNEAQQYHSHFILSLANIHLGQILALANNPEIQGEGLLEGKLPVYIDEERSLIKQGYLKNIDQGYIRFVPDPQSRNSLKQNPQMALLINVLTHLNYDELTADVNLDANGKMNLNGSIKGINPDFKNGYPIHFNPSIELDFTDMLRSLQISDSIDKKLRDRVNQKKLD